MLLVTKAHHSSQVSPKEWGLGYGPWAKDTAVGEGHCLTTLGFILFLSPAIPLVGSGAMMCWSQGWQSGGPASLVSCPCAQEMSSEYREYADSFGKVSTAWLAKATLEIQLTLPPTPIGFPWGEVDPELQYLPSSLSFPVLTRY